MSYRSMTMLMAAAVFAAADVSAGEIGFANDPFPPYVIGRMDQDAADGIALRLHREIFRRIDGGTAAHYRLMPWARALHSVETGERDGMMFLFRTPAREAIYDFTDALITTPLVVFYNRKRLPNGAIWDEIGDLSKYSSVATRGASYGERWDEAVKSGVLKPDLTTGPKETILMAAMGRVDFTPMNLYTGLYFIQELGLQGEIGIDEKPIHFSAYHMAFSKKSPHRVLVPKVNAVLEELHAEKFTERLLIDIRRQLTAPKTQ